jgi:hypothetical protein
MNTQKYNISCNYNRYTKFNNIENNTNINLKNKSININFMYFFNGNDHDKYDNKYFNGLKNLATYDEIMKLYMQNYCTNFIGQLNNVLINAFINRKNIDKQITLLLSKFNNIILYTYNCNEEINKSLMSTLIRHNNLVIKNEYSDSCNFYIDIDIKNVQSEIFDKINLINIIMKKQINVDIIVSWMPYNSINNTYDKSKIDLFDYYIYAGILITFKFFEGIDQKFEEFYKSYINDYKACINKTISNNTYKTYEFRYGNILVNKGVDEFFLNKHFLQHVKTNKGKIGFFKTYNLFDFFKKNIKKITNKCNEDEKYKCICTHYLNTMLCLPEHKKTNNLTELFVYAFKYINYDIKIFNLTIMTQNIIKNIYTICEEIYNKFKDNTSSFLLFSEKEHILINENKNILTKIELIVHEYKNETQYDEKQYEMHAMKI